MEPFGGDLGQSEKHSENKPRLKEAKKLFKILDFDDDDRIEFPELMLYIFSTEENLSRELKLKRSYNFYDNNGSGKISQEEMVEALGLVHDIEPRILNLQVSIFFHENDLLLLTFS